MYRKQLGIFARAPVSGAVKTRLVPPLTADEACTLYSALARDTFLRVEKLRKYALTIFYSGDGPGALEAWKPERASLVPQMGTDLGQRLTAAFDQLLEDDRPAVIIGTDSPDLPTQFIKRAFDRLKHRDVVLGPASDGGYYLVGLKRPAPELFRDIDWGTGSVLSQTIARLQSERLELALLPVWYDVDTADSLALLDALCRARKSSRATPLPETEAALEMLRDRIDF